MDNITIGHFIFAALGTFIYLIFILWGYKKELKIYKIYQYKLLTTFIYIVLIFIILVLIS